VTNEPSVVVSPGDAGAVDPTLVGGKAATLGRLAGAGLPVPDFFAVTAGAFLLHLDANAIAWPDPADEQGIARLRERVLLAEVPVAVASAVTGRYRRLCAATGHDHVAVRSSGAEEDSASASFAGQFTSLLGVVGEQDLLDALRHCWASCVSERSLQYRRGMGGGVAGPPAFGVLVQAQVFADKAGVLFTEHPIDPGTGCSYLEANFGTGESVTGGITTPDALEVSRLCPGEVSTRIGAKRRMTVVSPDAKGSVVTELDPERRQARVLTDEEATAIARAGLEVEALLGSPQDIEWAIDGRGLWILQARPITTSQVA
jgi:pyruvate,water dikinase